MVREAQGPWDAPQGSAEQGEARKVTGQEVQARILQVKAAIEAAKAANRPNILRTEVNRLFLFFLKLMLHRQSVSLLAFP